MGQVLGRRLRLSFEELGPTFIKFGQLLSSREDIFDRAFISEMKILRDKVRPLHFSKLRTKVEKSLNKKIEEVFDSIDETPIGTASIGVVYRGVLKNGEQVVLKVRRPGIKKEVETDFSILRFLVHQTEKISKEIKSLGLSRIVDDFSFSLIRELNFSIEALNAKKFAKALQKHNVDEVLYIPRIYDQFSSSDLLVMEYLKGISFGRMELLRPHLPEIKVKLDTGLRVLIRTFIQEGYFHADLHSGNFFFLDNKKIGLVDFGLMGSLSKRGRKSFVSIAYAIINFNYENLVFEFLEVAEYKTVPDVDALTADVREALSPFVGLTIQQTDFGMVIKSAIATLRKHKIFIPKEWFAFFRSLMVLDGVSYSLDMDFDIYAMMEEDLQTFIRDSFSKEELLEEGLWAANDFISVGRTIPRHIKWFLKDWSKKGHAHEVNIKGLLYPLKKINSSLSLLSSSLLTSVFIICGAFFVPKMQSVGMQDIPPISWVFWFLGIIFFVRGFFLSR